MGEFSGKVVIVTGGAKGIGRAISLHFAQQLKQMKRFDYPLLVFVVFVVPY